MCPFIEVLSAQWSCTKPLGPTTATQTISFESQKVKKNKERARRRVEEMNERGDLERWNDDVEVW